MTCYSLWFYLSKTVLPTGLGPLYELPARVDPLDWRFLGPALAVAVVTVALVALSRRWPAGLTVWVYYAIALGPIIGIVHSGLQLTNDRYSYLPALGFAVMFGGLTGVAARAAAARRLRPVIAGALGVTGAAWLIGLAVLTFNQVQIWRDTETLWRFAVDAEPDCVTCHSNLGIFLGNHGLTGLARQHFLRALEVRPDLVKTHYHLGFVEAASGNFAKAVEEYAIFLKRYPDDVDALNNSSAALMTLHRPDEALVQIQRALRLKPKHVFANTNLGYALAELGDREAALKQFRHTLELKFDTPQAWFGLVRVFLETGQLDAAHTAHGILGMIRWGGKSGPRCSRRGEVMLRALAEAAPAAALAAVCLLGLAIGSFLNVVIVRLPERRSLWRPPSACPGCGAPIAWYDNLPLLSFALLRGRCRACAMPISWRYPLVEAVTGAAFLSAYTVFGPTARFVVAAALLAALIAITAIDLQLQIIPNAITLPGIVAGVLANLGTGAVSWLEAVIGALLGGGVFLAIMLGYALLFREEGMGLGDAKLGAMLGAFLGWKVLLFSLFAAVTVGGVLAIVLLATGLRGRKDPIPFGPFLALGGATGLFWGEKVVAWYLSGFGG